MKFLSVVAPILAIGAYAAPIEQREEKKVEVVNLAVSCASGTCK
jgi:hypothetical protein